MAAEGSVASVRAAERGHHLDSELDAGPDLTLGCGAVGREGVSPPIAVRQSWFCCFLVFWYIDPEGSGEFLR
jgi:hypothetical protein